MTVKVRQLRKKWGVVIDYRGQRLSMTIGTEAEAETVAAQVELALLLEGAKALEKFRKQKKRELFGQYGRRIIGELKHKALRQSTRERHESIFKIHLEREFGEMQLEEITYAVVKQWVIVQQGRSVAKRTIRNHLATLRLILEEAVAEKKLKENAARNAKIAEFYRTAPMKEEVDPFTIEELYAVEDIIKRLYPWHWELTLCLSRTGLRMGEVRGLRWPDLDFSKRLIRIRRSHSYRREITDPKTSAGRRDVPMSAELALALKDLKRKRQEYWMAKGKSLPETVFTNQAGAPVDTQNFRTRVWVPAQKKAGVRERRVHDLRHTFASMMIQAGVPINRVSYWMGHSSAAVTLGIYTHYLPKEGGDDVSEILDRKSANIRKHDDERKENEKTDACK